MSGQSAIERERAARKAAEAKLAVLEQSQKYKDPAVGLVVALADSADGVAIWDASQTLLACNEAYKGVFGHHPFVEPGIKYADLMDLTYQERMIWPEGFRDGDWRVSLKDRRTSKTMPRIILESHDGRWFRLQNRHTATGGTLSMVVDITKSLAEHRETQRQMIEAEAASRAKSAFLANMSHEIRTPMNGVVGMADLLCETTLDDEQTLYAKTIRNSAEALLVIINDVLDYSKLEAEKLVLHPETFDLEHLIHEVVMLLQPTAQDKGVDLLVDYDLFLPTHFTADPGRLRQIITNLLGNAVKFTDDGHVLVRVTGLPVSDSTEMRLHIAIEDTGIGIPPDRVGAIFGQYNQVDDVTHQRGNSTGLGLTISKELVELMGGEIWVDSEQGEGSVFGFHITVPHEAAPTRLRQIDTADLRSVLVVDDLDVNLTILKKQLQNFGLSVHCALSAKAAEELLAQTEVDLIITDHLMPETNGLEFAQSLRAKKDKRPIILLSSNPLVLRSSDASKVFDVVLQKPLARHALLSSLDQIQGRRPDHKAHAKTLNLTVAQQDTQSSSDRPMRILTAEDNATNRLVFEKMTKDLNVDLVFAHDGNEAVDLFRSHKPDLIFMDISMPEKDGYTACREIRDLETRPTPICALTAHIDIEAASVDHSARFDRTLTKPLKKGQLLEMISEFRPKTAAPLFSLPQSALHQADKAG
ncbi:MAG: response regulator [Pseudomonadota bacterium]